jgi:hypothetical protein
MRQKGFLEEERKIKSNLNTRNFCTRSIHPRVQVNPGILDMHPEDKGSLPEMVAISHQPFLSGHP